MNLIRLEFGEYKLQLPIEEFDSLIKIDYFESNFITCAGGIKRSTRKVLDLCEKSCLKKDFPIKHLEHELNKFEIGLSVNRNKTLIKMLKARTNHPIIVALEEGRLIVRDGIHRLKKTKDILKKDFIDIILIDESTLPESTLFNTRECKEGYPKSL